MQRAAGRASVRSDQAVVVCLYLPRGQDDRDAGDLALLPVDLRPADEQGVRSRCG